MNSNNNFNPQFNPQQGQTQQFNPQGQTQQSQVYTAIKPLPAKIKVGSTLDSASAICKKHNLKEDDIIECITEDIKSFEVFDGVENALIELKSNSFSFKKWATLDSPLYFLAFKGLPLRFIVKNFNSDKFKGLSLQLNLSNTQLEMVKLHNTNN